MNKDIGNMVTTFHKTFGHPAPTEPTPLSKKRGEFRVELIQEEINELRDAINEGDQVEICDGLGDIIYLAVGTMVEMGLVGDIGHRIMNSIQDSNMSKACMTEDEARKFIDETTTEHGPLYEMEQVGELWVLKYRIGPKAGKIAKGPNTHRPEFGWLAKLFQGEPQGLPVLGDDFDDKADEEIRG